MYAKRFPIPVFDRDELKEMQWSQPRYLAQAEIDALVKRQQLGDAGAYGAYPVQADEELYGKLKLQGNHRHLVMCVLPDKPITVVGRSCAWAIQRAMVLDSRDANSFKLVLDWKTPRPMNTRLGPEDGVSIQGGIIYAVCCHRVGDHWVGNRTLIGKEWRGLPSAVGLAIFSSYNPQIDDFHDCNLYFKWAQ